MKYRLIDFYEDWKGDLLYETDRLTDIIKYAEGWDDDTDGECSLRCFLYDEEKKEYVEVRKNVALVLNPYDGNIMNN